MALPESAEPYWLQQQAISAAAVAVALRSWQVSAGNPLRWMELLPFVVTAIKRAQAAAAMLAPGYVSAAVRELSLDTAPMVTIDPAPLVGVTGSGYSIEQLYAELPSQLSAKATVIAGRADVQDNIELDDVPPEVMQEAMEATGQQLQANVQTVISDTGRAAESLEIAVRPGIGYVRMLNPPSCPRCVILAGRFYRWNAGFERHPRCDCRHVPASEVASKDLRVDPDRYFHSLTEQGQDAAFGKANAQAIRDGSDIGQVVNARRGMQTAQVYGERLRITSEGVTKRGVAGRAIRARGRNAATTPRLMPSSIYQIADDRADAVRLLRMNGYITDSNSGVKDLDAILARSA